MSSLTSLAESDFIRDSRAVINDNFEALNNDKLETSVVSTDTALTDNSDALIPTQKAVKAYVDTGGNVNASTTQRGIVEEATAAEVLARTAAGGSGARLFVNPSVLSNILKFGGTGADGALSISSGTTTINCSGARVLIKNYSSISITGTAKLAFSNPHASGTIIVLKCSGNVTLSSTQTPMIDVSNMGAAGASGGSIGASTGSGGSAGTAGQGFLAQTGAGAGGSYSGSEVSTGGVAAAASFALTLLTSALFNLRDVLVPGAGGGSGAAKTGGGGSATKGAGGRGAGALLIECGGTLTFTTAGGLSTTGTVGSNGSGAVGYIAAGGGGGGCGTVIVLYNAAGTVTGTVTNTGASGGSSASTGSTIADGNAPAGGGGGGGATAAGASGSSGTGTAGGVGYALVALNTLFA